MPQQTEILPPPRDPWYRRLLASPRYLVLVVAGILIVGGAAAFGVDQLASDDADTGAPAGGDSAPAADNREQADDGGDGGGQRQRPAIVPANVTVAVLNGTTVPNLAKQVSERVESHGFQVGTVANSADQEQQRAESVVLFAPGHEREAAAVGRRMSINQRQAIDPASQELAGDATVVVIAGADLAQ
jgi:LytR cell envelope-related transcriptional attenuator